MQPISIKRLVARPIATLSVEAQEMHEKSEKFIKKRNINFLVVISNCNVTMRTLIEQNG